MELKELIQDMTQLEAELRRFEQKFGVRPVEGYGATELSVRCAVFKGDEKVGNVFARRTVEAGGLYTVGAWKGVFETVAEDLVEELKAKLGE